MTSTMKETFTLKEIEAVLIQALQKIKAKNMNELSRYLPTDDGFRMHHFTLKKLKNDNPRKLTSLLKEFVLQIESPKELPKKPRKARLTSKQPMLNLEISDLQSLINLAIDSNNHDLAKKLSVSLPFSLIKKEMLKCIQEERIDLSLWNSYVESIQSRS